MKSIIISHGDCDGICSAAIALKKYPSSNLLFAQPFQLSTILRWEEVKEADNVIILDLAFNKEFEEPLLEIEGSKNLIYIDHHSSSLELKPKVKECLVDVSHSASQLASIYFKEPSVLSTIGAIGDKVILVSKTEPLFKEAELIRCALSYNVDDDDFRKELTYQLSSGKLPSEISAVVERARKSNEIKRKLVEIAKQNIVYNNEFIVCDVTNEEGFLGRAGVVAGEMSIKCCKPVFLIMKTNSNYVLVGRSHYNCNIDLNKLMKQFRGGGHRFAASSSITEEEYKNIIEILKYAVKRCMYG